MQGGEEIQPVPVVSCTVGVVTGRVVIVNQAVSQEKSHWGVGVPGVPEKVPGKGWGVRGFGWLFVFLEWSLWEEPTASNLRGIGCALRFWLGPGP